jgi:nucleoside-diphosphate-sugar epimerase
MILITGANGLIGRALTALYLKSGQALRLHVRSKRTLVSLFPDIASNPNVEIVEQEFGAAKFDDMRKLVTGCQTVIHTAALVHDPQVRADSYRVLNLEATQLLALAAREVGPLTFVFMSTIAVYGPGPYENIAEDATPSPDTPYAMTKLACENALRQVPPSARTIIFRCSLVFGEGDRGNMLSLIRQISRKRFVHPGASRARKSLIYAGDVAVAVAHAIDNVAPGIHIFNLANEHAPDVRTLAEMIREAVGTERAIPTVPPVVLTAGGFVMEKVLGHRAPLTREKLRKLVTSNSCSVGRLRETGFTARTPLRSALHAEVTWARQNGLL